MEEFKLEGKEYIALCDLLKVVGFCENGGHAKTVISENLVSVDGKIETRKRCKIRSGQEVEYNSQKISVK